MIAARVLTCGLFSALVTIGCSTKDTHATQSSGIVPADMRDVERDGEGLVVTTFGAFPERTPDWQRAGSVLGLLKEVWSRSKAQNPHLPSAESLKMDRAIASLDAAIAG